MTGLIKHKLAVQTRGVLGCFFCCLPTVYSAQVGGDVVADYQGPSERDGGAAAMAAVSSNYGRVWLGCISNSRTEAQQ